MRVLKSFGYAIKGFYKALREQLNLRIHVMVLAGVTGAGFYYKITGTEWVLILLTAGLVISMELMNTAMEVMADMVTREQRPTIAKIKDIAAAAVLFSAIIAVITGLIIFAKYIF